MRSKTRPLIALTLAVLAQGCSPWPAQAPEMRPGAPSAAITPIAGMIVGRVNREQADGDLDLSVSAYLEGGTSGPVATGSVAPDGRFALAVGEGAYNVIVRARAGDRTGARYHILAGTAVDIDLRAGGTLTGKLTADGHGALEGTEVFVAGTDVRGFAGVDGEFVLRNVPAGTWTVGARSGDRLARVPGVSLAAGAAATVVGLRLGKPLVSVRVTVSDVPDGVFPAFAPSFKAIAQAGMAATIKDADGKTFSSTLDHDDVGRLGATFTGVVPGKYTFSFASGSVGIAAADLVINVAGGGQKFAAPAAWTPKVSVFPVSSPLAFLTASNTSDQVYTAEAGKICLRRLSDGAIVASIATSTLQGFNAPNADWLSLSQTGHLTARIGSFMFRIKSDLSGQAGPPLPLGNATDILIRPSSLATDVRSAGLIWAFPGVTPPRVACRVATTFSLSLSLGNFAGTRYTLATVGPLFPIDGVSLRVGDRVLFKNQSDLRLNGLWVVENTGSSTTFASFTRYPDVTPTQGDRILVTEGTANFNSRWVTQGSSGLYSFTLGAPGDDAVAVGKQVLIKRYDDSVLTQAPVVLPSRSISWEGLPAFPNTFAVGLAKSSATTGIVAMGVSGHDTVQFGPTDPINAAGIITTDFRLDGRANRGSKLVQEWAGDSRARAYLWQGGASGLTGVVPLEATASGKSLPTGPDLIALTSHKDVVSGYYPAGPTLDYIGSPIVPAGEEFTVKHVYPGGVGSFRAPVQLPNGTTVLPGNGTVNGVFGPVLVVIRR